MIAGATYDEIGNPLTYGTGDEQWSFTWQRGRQLAGLTTPDHTISYKYNADGLRTEKTVDGVTWEYIWDGSKLIAMYDGTTEWRFIYDAGGEIVGFIYGASTYYYVKNLQGDVIKILDNYCNEIVTYTYDSWGNVIAQGGSSAYVSLGQKNPIRYRGYFYDTDTGLYYLQSRYYNPQWGRFVNADGYVQTGQGILDKNMFAYCGNNPVNMSDPTGYCTGFVGRCYVCGEWMGNSYMQDKGTSFTGGFSNVSTGVHKNSYDYMDKNDGSTKTRDVYIVSQEQSKSFSAPEGSVVVVDIRSNADNPDMQIRDSYLYCEREEQTKILTIIMAYDDWYPSSNDWKRTTDSMLIEWDAHNDSYYNYAPLVKFVTGDDYKENAAHVDFDNNTEGKTYSQILLDFIKSH